MRKMLIYPVYENGTEPIRIGGAKIGVLPATYYKGVLSRTATRPAILELYEEVDVLPPGGIQ